MLMAVSRGKSINCQIVIGGWIALQLVVFFYDPYHCIALIDVLFL